MLIRRKSRSIVYGRDLAGRFRCSKLSLEKRFWSNVRKTNHCWLWTAQIDNKGCRDRWRRNRCISKK